MATGDGTAIPAPNRTAPWEGGGTAPLAPKRGCPHIRSQGEAGAEGIANPDTERPVAITTKREASQVARRIAKRTWELQRSGVLTETQADWMADRAIDLVFDLGMDVQVALDTALKGVTK